VPIIEPEVDIKAADKAKIETFLCQELLAGLGKLGPKEKVMFKLTIPTEPNTFKALPEHKNCVRLVALSGGYSREESCKHLAANTRMIASFSRAFAEGLNYKQTDEEFTKTIDNSIQMIFEASKTNPVEPVALRKPRFSKVNTINPDSDGLNLYLKVVKKSDEVIVQDGNVTIVEAVAGDDTGCLIIRLRGDAHVKLGSTAGNSIVVQNARVRMIKGRIRIEVDKWGVLRKSEGDHLFTVLESKNLSETEYELVSK